MRSPSPSRSTVCSKPRSVGTSRVAISRLRPASSCLTHRVVRRRLFQPCLLTRCQRFPRPGPVWCPHLCASTDSTPEDRLPLHWRRRSEPGSPSFMRSTPDRLPSRSRRRAPPPRSCNSARFRFAFALSGDASCICRPLAAVSRPRAHPLVVAHLSWELRVWGQLSLNEERGVRFHGQVSGLHLLDLKERVDGRNEGGIWSVIEFLPFSFTIGILVEDLTESLSQAFP